MTSFLEFFYWFPGKTEALSKIIYMDDIYVLGTLNQLFIRDSYTQIKFSSRL